MNDPKISIITAVFNGEKFLRRYLKSVIDQNYSNYEIIIIDGGSSDSSVSIIREFEDNITYWISERDKGIYDAWNKGIDKATGDWIMFIGCDDTLIPGALSKYADFISKLPKNNSFPEIISSKVQMIDEKGKSIRVKGWKFEWPLFLKEMTIAHPGALHSKKLFEKYGKFDINYKIVGDYELLLRAGENLQAAFMNEITVIMSEGGVSDSVKAIKEHYKAVTKSGQYSKRSAFTNAVLVYLKFRIKKAARQLGWNVFLKKDNNEGR